LSLQNPETRTDRSTWAPLRVPIFRALFAAQLGSNIGNWMETVGAQWILVHHPRAETLVALVQTADMLPFMFLALPPASSPTSSTGAAI
jgi:Transmembrane secretion effector